MTEDKNKKIEEQKDSKTTDGKGEVVEKRIKPAVIRRRAAKPKPAPVEAPPVVEEEPTQTPVAKAGTGTGEGKEASKAAKKPDVREPEKMQAGAKKAVEKAAEPKSEQKAAQDKGKSAQVAAVAGAKEPGKVQKGARTDKKPAARRAKPSRPQGGQARGADLRQAAPKDAQAKPGQKPADAPPAAKREVKVFDTKEPPRQQRFPTRQVFRKGKRYQIKHVPRKSRAVSHSRPLKKTEITERKAEKRVIKINDVISVGEFSMSLGVKSSEIIKKLMAMDVMVTMNQPIDVDAATLIAQEYGFEVENVAVQETTLIDTWAVEEGSGKPEHRAPVVTVMGHVDHGKTSLLDAIRDQNVASGEAGGITQHIGAYHVHLPKGDITFLDTPGHEAFTAMRARGAKSTDIVVLVVAADDGVMPQTVEAINHAKAAEVPIIVAINKIDVPQANPDRVKQALSEHGLVAEDWGGDAIFVEVSAKQRTNIQGVLEMILLQAEMLELRAVKDMPASGVIVEAKLDKGRGPVSTALVQTGTVKVGDACVAGVFYGKVKAMVSDWGKRIKEAGPSMPVEILGLSGVPDAGDTFSIVKDEATAKQIATMRLNKAQVADSSRTARVSLTDLYDSLTQGEVKELNVIVKGDVQGSIEAVVDALNKLSTDKVTLKAIHTAVGGINEGDVMLAAASSAIIIGFNVRPEVKANKLAEAEGVDVKLYNVIYNLIDDIRNAMEGLLEPIVREEVLGRIEVREVFRVTRVGNVAGCYVTEGKVIRSARVRLIRDNVVIYEGNISSLKRFKDDAKEVATGYECGISIEGYNDIKVGDVIEPFILKEEAAKL